jgi:hypothetical protein
MPVLLKKRFRLPWKNPNQRMLMATTHEKKYENMKKGNLRKSEN